MLNDSGENILVEPLGFQMVLENEDGSQDTLDGTTGAVDNSTILPDGVYTPDSFSYSGGSGRAQSFLSELCGIRPGSLLTEPFDILHGKPKLLKQLFGSLIGFGMDAGCIKGVGTSRDAHEARALLDNYSTEGMEAMNRDYIARNISPGGSADMVALTLFIHTILN